MKFLKGTISEDEWVAFWEEVKRAGYTDEYIREEVFNLLFLYFYIKILTNSRILFLLFENQKYLKIFQNICIILFN